MKKFLSKLGLTASPAQTKILTQHRNCSLHDMDRYPSIKANEHCETCNLNMCYICSGKHISGNCIVRWSENSIRKENTGKLALFNQGYVSLLHFQNLKCACGKNIHAEEGKGGICVACGSAVCSIECHKQYIEQTQKCSFHLNFNKDLQNSSMISIIFKNVKNFYDGKFIVGTPINKTSSAFIKASLSYHSSEIFLQRGYRQYGDPSVLKRYPNNLVIEEKNLDFRIHKNRKCACKCSQCKGIAEHPVDNCKFSCRNNEMAIIQDYMVEEELEEQCKCTCKFCLSGISVLGHKKIDCFNFCEKSSAMNDD